VLTRYAHQPSALAHTCFQREDIVRRLRPIDGVIPTSRLMLDLPAPAHGASGSRPDQTDIEEWRENYVTSKSFASIMHFHDASSGPLALQFVQRYNIDNKPSL